MSFDPALFFFPFCFMIAGGIRNMPVSDSRRPSSNSSPTSNSTTPDAARRALLQLHFATMIMAWAGILAKLMDPSRLDAFQKTCLRCLIAAPLLILVAQLMGGDPFGFARRHAKRIGWTGVLLAGHWSLFFVAVEVSTAAVGQLSIYTFPIMVALMEPLIRGTRFRRATLVNGALVFGGLAVIFLTATYGPGAESPVSDVTGTETPTAPDRPLGNVSLGIGLGLLSALCYAGRNLGSQSLTQEAGGVATVGWQAVVIALVLMPALFLRPMNPAPIDALWLLLLAVIVTGVGHTLFVGSFAKLSVASASVATGLQPIYIAIYAWIILDERPTIGLAIGGVLILSAVIRETLSSARSINEQARASPELSTPISTK